MNIPDCRTSSVGLWSSFGFGAPGSVGAITLSGIERLNVSPGLINPRLINRGVSPFSGGLSLLEGTPPLMMGQVY